jgi:hypothetical protein
MFNLYPRPIPTPVANLRPARETCEQCHWPEKFEGDRLRVLTGYSPDQENTAVRTVLLMRIGGVHGNTARGIHWHVAPGVQIRYRSNPERTVISAVEVKQPNRPTHIFVPPDRAVDAALERGRISTALPFVKREGVRLVQASYPSQEQARASIPAALLSFYQASYPELVQSRRSDIEQAGAGLLEVYADNVFPAMKVRWNAYPNFLGHTDEAGGCFRCHDSQHTSKSGDTIDQDCSSCHEVLADQEKDPPILRQLSP